VNVVSVKRTTNCKRRGRVFVCLLLSWKFVVALYFHQFWKLLPARSLLFLVAQEPLLNGLEGRKSLNLKVAQKLLVLSLWKCSLHLCSVEESVIIYEAEMHVIRQY